MMGCGEMVDTAGGPVTDGLMPNSPLFTRTGKLGKENYGGGPFLLVQVQPSQPKRVCGGTGIRAGLRIQWPKGLEGSNPSKPTKIKKEEV